MVYTLGELYDRGIPKLLHGVNTKEQWLAKRKKIMETWLKYIGEIPEQVETKYKVVSETKESDHIRKKIIYTTAYDDHVSAYLLVPYLEKDNQKSYSAILALHPTNQTGKEDISVYPGKANRLYGLELVKRGYVVLAPDALSAGERTYPGYKPFENAPFYEQHPSWSSVAKNIVDHRSGIDVLQSLPYVDSDAIGVIGHSFGGYNAYFTAIFDQRIKALVCSCGFATFAGDYRPQQWGNRDWYTHIPKLTKDVIDGIVPFEFNEIAALTAPTPFFNYSAQSDLIFPHWKSIGDGLHEIFYLYQWLGEGDKFKSYIGAGGHDFPPDIRKMSYEFLDKWLGRSDDYQKL